ncbi:TetR/AcrR family transcriptional regulator [Mycolicibacterium thermoresistibile]
MALKRSRPGGRRRVRSAGPAASETRSRILDAARQIIVERGYPAATCQVIARAAGVSRPTLHYYFASREEIYDCLVEQSRDILADCAERAMRRGTLVERLTEFGALLREVDSRDHSTIAFLISARLEGMRNRDLGEDPAMALHEFFTGLLDDAVSAGELPDDTDVESAVEVMYTVLWGLGFYTGFVERSTDMLVLAEQLENLFASA